MRDLLDLSAVLAWRVPMLWLHAMDPTPRRRNEAERMVTEKVVACWSGAMRAQLALMGAMPGIWLAIASGRSPAWAIADAARFAAAASQVPARTALRANARRLSRRRTM